MRITVDGIGQYITDCTPDTTGQLAVLPTTEGCDNPMTWEHDLTAGQSYGQERYYFLKNGQPEYVTDCQRSADIYTHQVEITGWQNHDDQLFAYPLTTVYITPPTGRYDISVSQVQSGATQMPYELTGNATRETGTPTYEGCDRYSPTEEVAAYNRPDGTVFEKALGPGPVVGPTDVCVSTVVGSQNLKTGNQENLTGVPCGNRIYTRELWDWYQTVNKIELKNIDTGVIVATTCEFANGSAFTGWKMLAATVCIGGTGGWTPAQQTLFVGPQYNPPCPF